MSEGNNRNSSQLEYLRAAYEDAFRNWSAEVNRMRSAGRNSSPESSDTREIRRKLAETRKAYHDARESLAARLLCAQSGDRRAEVEQLAYQLWERSGRRSGDAEADWYRAEQLVNSRQAAV